MDKLAFVDIETTGTSFYNDRIIDIGIVLYKNGKKIHEFSSLINPNTPINPYVSMMTGISQPDLTDSPAFADIHEEILTLLDQSVFIAHNVRFDYGFIKRELEYMDRSFNMPHLCSAKLSRKLYPRFRRHNLDAIIKRFDIQISQRHRALPDAQAIGYFYEKNLATLGAEKLHEVMDTLLKAPKYPRYINKKMVQDLPDSPGVYVMYGRDDEVLYVGKSINVRDRVISHFYQDIKSQKELAIKNQTRFIEGIPTAGELEALILESNMIKNLSPIYNRALRRKKVMWGITAHKNNAGYLQLEIKEIKDKSYSELKDMYFVAGRKSTVKNTLKQKIKEHTLCNKLCGMEKTQKACFNSQIGKCLGACKGLEPPESYNERVELAFEKTKTPQWPYKGAVVVGEQNVKTKKHAYYLVYNWQLVDTSERMEDLDLNKDITEPDLDTQKILQKFIRRGPTDRVINFEG